MKHTERRASILSAALQIAGETNLELVKHRTVASRAGISLGLVTLHFPTSEELKDGVTIEAIRVENFRVYLQALLAKREAALRCSQEFTNKAVTAFFNLEGC